MVNLISTMNQCFPDYEFSSLSPDKFRREFDKSSVIDEINYNLTFIVERCVPGFACEFWDAIKDAIDLETCEVYSYAAGVDVDPFSDERAVVHSFDFFFFDRRSQRILFFSCVTSSKLTARATAGCGRGFSDNAVGLRAGEKRLRGAPPAQRQTRTSSPQAFDVYSTASGLHSGDCPPEHGGSTDTGADPLPEEPAAFGEIAAAPSGPSSDPQPTSSRLRPPAQARRKRLSTDVSAEAEAEDASPVERGGECVGLRQADGPLAARGRGDAAAKAAANEMPHRPYNLKKRRNTAPSPGIDLDPLFALASDSPNATAATSEVPGNSPCLRGLMLRPVPEHQQQRVQVNKRSTPSPQFQAASFLHDSRDQEDDDDDDGSALDMYIALSITSSRKKWGEEPQSDNEDGDENLEDEVSSAANDLHTMELPHATFTSATDFYS
eukprot:GHVT01041790.1.p1 GENE.GHVT01041790.1~~GHVT01041790.1.p1  ORF type:complete len:437 (-),score=109.69 GHVT01041790.1:3462-4772(-)